MSKRPSEPAMNDPADRDIRRREGRDPYPEPVRGAKRGDIPKDDMADPGEDDSKAPHDRGVMKGDEHVGAREDMIDHLGNERDAWAKGLTQSRPAPD